MSKEKYKKSVCSEDSSSTDGTAYTSNHDNCNYGRSRIRKMSDSSVEICVVLEDSDGDEKVELADSGISDKMDCDDDMTRAIQKIDQLNNMLQEQSRLLSTLKEEILNSRIVMEKALTDLISIVQSCLNDLAAFEGEFNTETSASKRLLDALEARLNPDSNDKTIIKDVVNTFLQSDDFQALKECMVDATAESMKDMIGSLLSQDFTNVYSPILEQAHKRLVRDVAKAVEEAFFELEENSGPLFKSVCKVTRSLLHYVDGALVDANASLQNNLKNTLKCTMEELLHKETHQKGQTALEVFSSQLQSRAADLPPPPPPPLECKDYSQQPNRAIEQLMVAAEISNLIAAGEVNAAFERALNATDLALVRAACRAGQHCTFVPRCRLRPHVLLALLQQLSTDMLHDTYLKCRYLEDAIINLDPSDPITRTHLPLVVREVRKHLTNFITCHPGHAAGRRLAFIILAADSLLK